MRISAYSPQHLNLSRLKVLRSLQVGHWITPFEDANYRRTIVQIFSTITSPVFSELAIVCWYRPFTRLLSDTASFETLRMLNEVRPFKLVFLLQALDRPSTEVRQSLDSSFRSTVVEGLFDFLDSPPDIHFVRASVTGGGPDWEWLPPAVRYPTYAFEAVV